MTTRKLIIVCPEATHCCGTGSPCYADRCKNDLGNKYPWLTVEIICGIEDPFIIRHGITKFPGFIFMKDNAVVTRHIGKYMDDTIEKTIAQLKW